MATSLPLQQKQRRPARLQVGEVHLGSPEPLWAIVVNRRYQSIRFRKNKSAPPISSRAL